MDKGAVTEIFMKKLVMIIMTAALLAGCGNTQDTAGEKESLIESTKQSENDEVLSEDSKVTEAVLETPLITWDEKNVEIAGIGQEYEIWFLADSHIIMQDGSETEEVAEYAAQRMPGFTNEMGVSSDAVFSHIIDEANEQKPDMILFGGDIIDFPSDANVSFLTAELDRLEVPYVFVMGNHDWTFPWEYMTEEGSAKYRPMLENHMDGNFTDESEKCTAINKNVLSIKSNSYYSMVELEDLVILSVDDSFNQVAEEALEGIEEAYNIGKPIILMQHVPFSTENLIAEAKKSWSNPVTLGMQVHGGIAPNGASTELWEKTHDDESLIKVVLAGHVHFPYEEKLSESTIQIITDAAFKGKAVKLKVTGIQHQYFCDKFVLTVDDKQYDLKEVVPEMSSVSELLPITDNHLYILGRIDESNNALLIYDFEKDEFVLNEQGTTVCWVQNDYESTRYLKDNVVYDLEGTVIYEPDESKIISMIEYVEKDFKVTVTDLNHENPQEIWIE